MGTSDPLLASTTPNGRGDDSITWMDPAVQNLTCSEFFNLEVECLNCWCKLVNQESSSRAAVFLDVPLTQDPISYLMKLEVNVGSPRLQVYWQYTQQLIWKYLCKNVSPSRKANLPIAKS